MFRGILGVVSAVLLCTGIAAAGDTHAEAAGQPDAAAKMTAMKAEMMKCSVCKTLAPHMDELGPVMTWDIARLNDGIALMHGVSDPALVEKYHAVGAEMHKAGEGCMAMTDEQAKTQLCSFCQEVRSLVKAGATFSVGNTKMGDVMVFTSKDPALLQRINDLGTKCESQMASM